MKQCAIVVSIFLSILFSLTSTCQQHSTFVLTYSEDKRAFHSRLFHVFYEPDFKSVAEMIKCQLSGTVKDVTLEEIQGKRELSSICKMEAYTSKIEDKTKQRNYMATITRQLKFSEALTRCDALNQLNLIKTPMNQWAVLIRGHATDIILPLKSEKGGFKKSSLDFALNSLFFASAYGFGDSTFKSLGGETGVREKLLFITVIVYVVVVFVAVVALVILVVLFFIRRKANIRKRESEKSKLLRNPANNTDNDAPVEIVYDSTSDIKS